MVNTTFFVDFRISAARSTEQRILDGGESLTQTKLHRVLTGRFHRSHKELPTLEAKVRFTQGQAQHQLCEDLGHTARACSKARKVPATLRAVEHAKSSVIWCVAAASPEHGLLNLSATSRGLKCWGCGEHRAHREAMHGGVGECTWKRSSKDHFTCYTGDPRVATCMYNRSPIPFDTQCLNAIQRWPNASLSSSSWLVDSGCTSHHLNNNVTFPRHRNSVPQLTRLGRNS